MEFHSTAFAGNSPTPPGVIVTPVADAYGPFTAYVGTAASGITSTIVPAPPAGYMNRVRSVVIAAATTTDSSAGNVRATAIGTGCWICARYARANGLTINWSGDLTFVDALGIGNTTSVLAAGYFYVRQEPILTLPS